MLTYTINGDGQSITCHDCGMTSNHPDDVRYLYCGNCHEFHAEKTVANAAIMAEATAEQRCYCGWHRVGECPHCPAGKTCADKFNDRGNAMPSSVCQCNESWISNEKNG